MRSIMISLLLVLVLSIVLISAVPVADFEDQSLEHHSRVKRATCDLFQDERLCAAHCLARGRSGGYCNAQKVCVCR
ncbi:unnamed protein product [Diamesa serratosioi]